MIPTLKNVAKLGTSFVKYKFFRIHLLVHKAGDIMNALSRWFLDPLPLRVCINYIRLALANLFQ